MKRAGRRFIALTGAAALAVAAVSPPTVVAGAPAAPALEHGPYLTGLSSVAVEVRFELDSAAPAEVSIKPGEADGSTAAARTVEDPTASMHVVRVTGLEPGRAYGYAVRAGGAMLGMGRFVTAPKEDAGQSVKFLLYGDDRSNDAVHAAIVQSMLATPSDFLVNTGDLVADGGSAPDWEAFFRIEQSLLRDRALFLAIGNHELYDDQAGSNFARYFGYTDASGVLQPFGTARWGIVRFFFLNGMHTWQGGPEREWLERALVQADGESDLVWRVAVVHQSPWSSGPHGGNAELLDAHIPELLGEHHVDLLLAGHDHIYERGDAGRLKYVISGGGGAPLYPVGYPTATTRKAESTYHFVEVTLSQESVGLVAHRLDGTTLDSCGFSKASAWDCDAKPRNEASADSPWPAHGSLSRSRCGCSLPGLPAGVDAGALLALGAAGAAVGRRRRG